MGAWSHEPFGNDAACAWVDRLLETEDLSHIESSLDAVINASNHLDADLASEAIAAIEVLARLLGKGTLVDTDTEHVDQWIADHSERPSPTLRQKAGQVLVRVQAPDSELLQLWEEGQEAGAWKASLQLLQAAISD